MFEILKSEIGHLESVICFMAERQTPFVAMGARCACNDRCQMPDARFQDFETLELGHYSNHACLDPVLLVYYRGKTWLEGF